MIQEQDLKDFLEVNPDLSGMVKSIITLSLVGETLTTPIFSRTDAIGSLMRKKINHITSPLLSELASLRK